MIFGNNNSALESVRTEAKRHGALSFMIPGSGEGDYIQLRGSIGNIGQDTKATNVEKLAKLWYTATTFNAALEQITVPAMQSRPALLRRVKGKGAEDWEPVEDKSGLIEWLGNRPNPEMSTASWIEMKLIHFYLFGLTRQIFLFDKARFDRLLLSQQTHQFRQSPVGGVAGDTKENAGKGDTCDKRARPAQTGSRWHISFVHKTGTLGRSG